MADRVSQIAVEVVEQGNPNARVSQLAVEVVEHGNPNALVSQLAVEVVHANPTNAHLRVSQYAVEVVIGVPHLATLPFIGSATAVYAPTLVGTVNVPFISSVSSVYALALVGTVDVPFIGSVTAVYALALTGDIAVPFIGSATAVYTPTLVGVVTEVDVPFIVSTTRVYGIFSLFVDSLRTGPGNGGEGFAVLLAPNGTVETATLAVSVGDTTSLIVLTGDGSLPSTDPFCLLIDDELVYVAPMGGGSYRVRRRGVGNTTAAAHTAGAVVAWGDTYRMAITATEDIVHEFTADITGSGLTTYPGWLICFDATQAYLAGDRYPMHVTEVVGVFPAGTGTAGTNRCDAAQPNAVASAAGVSDDCPAALSNPSRISSDIAAGDAAVVLFTNPEASALLIGHRSVALQSWFGLKRVDVADGDVTFTDPAGYVVDTNPGVGPFTGSVNGEWDDPLGPGVGPDTGLPTTTDVPYTSVTLPGGDRYFTNPDVGFAEKGWPICALAVRQGRRRVPYWESWDWRNYNYVYSGFATDATYVQLLINRNGIVFGSVPEVALPGPQDIDGPDAVWDDGSYRFGASWYVAIFSTPYLVIGPSLGGTLRPDVDLHGVAPVVRPHPGGGVDVFVPGTGGGTVVEGGAGGGINPPVGELFDVALV